MQTQLASSARGQGCEGWWNAAATREGQAPVTIPWEWRVRGQCDTFSARTIQVGSRRPDNQVRNQTAKRQMRDPRGRGSTLTPAAPLEGRGWGVQPTSPTRGREGSEAF